LGISSTDLLLVLNERRAVDEILGGELALGAEAVVAAGPTGSSNKHLTGADVFGYRRTGGLFAGISLLSGALALDEEATRTYYSLAPAGSTVTGYYPSIDEIIAPSGGELRWMPEEAQQLRRTVQEYAGQRQQKESGGANTGRAEPRP